MGHCVNHPDRETNVVCQRLPNRGYCDECLDKGAPCFEPEVYCKFRTACVIWELARENGLTKQDQIAARAAAG